MRAGQKYSSDFMGAHGRGWAETFGEFSAWLDEAGITVDALPEWHSSAPVRVVALPGRLYLKQVGRREYRRFKDMAAGGRERLRALPLKRLGEMHAVQITAVDVARLRAWQAANEGAR